MLSDNATKRLMIALTSKDVGHEVADAINAGAAAAAGSTLGCVAFIVATATSTTTDFAALKVGDRVLVTPASAGNGKFGTVATAGTLPFAAVIGSSYTVLRAISTPAAVSVPF